MNVTRTIGFNGLGEFSVIIYFEDGTADSIGPFASGEEAAAAIYSLEEADYAESNAESAHNILRGTIVEWEDMPF